MGGALYELCAPSTIPNSSFEQSFYIQSLIQSLVTSHQSLDFPAIHPTITAD